jgi:hypothetical protein
VRDVIKIIINSPAAGLRGGTSSMVKRGTNSMVKGRTSSMVKGSMVRLLSSVGAAAEVQIHQKPRPTHQSNISPLFISNHCI